MKENSHLSKIHFIVQEAMPADRLSFFVLCYVATLVPPRLTGTAIPAENSDVQVGDQVPPPIKDSLYVPSTPR